MADRPDPEHGGDTPDHGSTTGTPGWVKACWLILLGVIVLLVVVKLVGGDGGHGPGRHGAGTGAPPTSVTEEAGTVPPSEAGHGGRQP